MDIHAICSQIIVENCPNVYEDILGMGDSTEIVDMCGHACRYEIVDRDTIEGPDGKHDIYLLKDPDKYMPRRVKSARK